jgi:heavy metal sensor kinase
VLELGLALAETEATLAQFDRRVAAGGLAFLALAVGGGLVLSRQALRPVAQSIRTARHLNPADLTARLPGTGAGDELDQLAGTINDLLDRLAVYHAQATRFTADASHELRSPLGAIRATIEVALQQPRAADEYRDVLGSLGEQCDRLTALVNALLLLARADTGQVELHFEPIDLTVLAQEVAEMYQPLAEEKGVSLVWDHPSPVPARGDPPRLRHLLTNLVDNAIKFTDPGGTVTIRLERRGQEARIDVTDTGVGIPAEHLAHVFERFYQSDPARSLGGTGLGLSICRWIAQAHGGSIHATSESDQGSTFTVVLPASPVDTAVKRGIGVLG